MATYTSHLNLKLPDYSDTADINDLNDNFKKIDDAIASGGTETDPTVPAWAKQPSKPTYTASEVGARPDTWTPSADDVGADAAGTASGAVAAHNTSGAAHEDLRALIDGLTNRLNSLADSDDTTLDQLSEIVAYIKSNKALIDAVTTGKVSTSDIVDNLTTNASGKVLSAAQGVALKAMIDGIVIPTALPNPQPITINGQRYDGSEAVTVTTVEIDDTLTQSGKAADAKVVGDQLSELNDANAELKDDLAQITDVTIDYKEKQVTWNDGGGITKDGNVLSFSSIKWCSFSVKKGDYVKITGGYSNYKIMWYTVIYNNGDSVFVPIEQNTEPTFRDGETATILAEDAGTVYVSASTNIYHPCTIEYGEKVVSVDVSKSPLSPVMDNQVNEKVLNWFSQELNGKKFSCIGDSIMRGAGNKNVGFMEMIATKCSMTIENLAVSGATLARGTSSSNYICDQIDNVSPESDYIIIEGGFNDLMQNVPLGTLSIGYRTEDFDVSTLYGALESIMKKALLKKVGVKVGFVIVHRINNAYRITNREDNLTFDDFREAIIKTCAKYAIPVCDLYAESNFITDNTSYYGMNTDEQTNPYYEYTSNGTIPDGVHPTEEGYKLFYVPKVQKWLALM